MALLLHETGWRDDSPLDDSLTSAAEENLLVASPYENKVFERQFCKTIRTTTKKKQSGWGDRIAPPLVQLKACGRCLCVCQYGCRAGNRLFVSQFTD